MNTILFGSFQASIVSSCMAEGLWEGPYWEGLGTGAPPEETQRVVPVGPGQGDPGLWR